MTEVRNSQKNRLPPPTFVSQVKHALEHLYDIDDLERHPLVCEDGPADKPSALIAGQRLRWELSAAIESLNPGVGTPFSAPPARIYNLLSLRYVERHTVQRAAQELGLSERQAHRDLRRGEENVAAILWSRRSEFPPLEPNAIRLSSFEAEMARLHLRPHLANLGELVKRAQVAVEPQAAERNIHLEITVPDEPAIFSLDPVIAEQVLVNTLSQALEQACPGTIQLALTAEDERAILTLCYYPELREQDASAIDLVILQLADRLGWTVEHSSEPEGLRTITLRMVASGPTVLVIDDNEGLLSLLERYLTDQSCRVVGAANGQRGLGLAQSVMPDAIILDVMMPEMHGWEFLQRLRTIPEMSNIPVIICSVINNPRLAYCLGASVFLPKPVTRGEILDALHHVGVL